jgi:hypothetical protein
MCRVFLKGGDPMSSRLLKFPVDVAAVMATGVAQAYSSAAMKARRS